MITYYRVYFDSEEFPYADTAASDTEEAINKVFEEYNVSSELAGKINRVVPLKLYKAVYEYTVTKQVELYAEDEDAVKDLLRNYKEDPSSCDSVVDVDCYLSGNTYKSIEEE